MAVVAPERRAWGVVTSNGQTSISVSSPPGTGAGDLVVFAVAGGDPSATTITPPAEVTTVLDRNQFGSRIGYIFAVTCADPSDEYEFTLSDPTSAHFATMAIRTTADPATLTTGTIWERSGSSGIITAPAVTVPEAGALVLAMLYDASTNSEKETDVSYTGLNRWFFSRQSDGTETVAVHYSDNSVVGLTDETTATYPHTSSNGMGVQLIIPAAPAGTAPPPTASYLMVTGQRPNSLRIGGKVSDAATVYAIARPVGGGANVTTSPIAGVSSGWTSVKVTGLDAGRSYDVDLVSAGQVLGTARGATLGITLDAFTVVTGSCQANNADPVVFDQMASDGAAFFHHQGDLHYRDTQVETTWRAGVDIAFSTPRMRSFIASTPVYYRWDNHDWGGSVTWRESPIGNFAPDAIRELFGDEFPHDKALYRTWAHRGVRFIDTDQWTLRDEAQTTPNTDNQVGKTMWSTEQRTWFFQTLMASTEPLIVWFSSFPLYSNLIGGNRWGNYMHEVGIIQAFFDDHPEIRDRMVAVGGDSHSICADDGTNAMWGLASLNASPFSQTGGLASGTWNIANVNVDDDRGYYSRLGFDWTASDVELTWEAVRDDGTVISDWTNSYPIDWTGESPTFPDLTHGVAVWDGAVEIESRMSVWDGSVERVVTTIEVVEEE